MKFAVLLSIVCGLIVPSASGAPAPDELVKMTLLADVSAVEPGRPFTLGIHLKHAPRWHTYWINPGDSGQATSVKFDLPPGFTVGELQFPVPMRIVLPGDIVSFGYEDEVMLLATVTPPQELNPSEPIRIAAHGEWLVCEEVCLPGEGSCSIDLRVADKAQPANAEQFAKWLGQVPQTEQQANMSVKLDQNIGDRGSRITMQARWNDGSPKQVEWFPPASDDFTFSRAEIEQVGQQVGQQVGISFTAELLSGKTMSSAKTFASVIAYTDPAGNRRGVVVPFTVDPPRSSAKTDK